MEQTLQSIGKENSNLVESQLDISNEEQQLQIVNVSHLKRDINSKFLKLFGVKHSALLFETNDEHKIFIAQIKKNDNESKYFIHLTKLNENELKQFKQLQLQRLIGNHCMSEVVKGINFYYNKYNYSFLSQNCFDFSIEILYYIEQPHNAVRVKEEFREVSNESAKKLGLLAIIGIALGFITKIVIEVVSSKKAEKNFAGENSDHSKKDQNENL